MSPAAGAAAPAQPAAASFDPAPAPTAAIGAPPQPQENLRDPSAQAEGGDPGNAAVRKTAWNVPPPPPPSVAPVGGGIMGGEESWPALADAAAGRAWPKSASSDSLRSLSDASAPSAPEDLIVPSVPSQPVSSPISAAPSPSPASASPTPLSVAAGAPSPQNGSTIQPDLFWHGSRHGGNSGGKGHMVNNGGDKSGNGSNRSRSTGNNSSDGNSTSGGDVNWNDAGFGGGININSSVHIDRSNINSSVHTGCNDLNSNVHTGGSNVNSNFHNGNISGSGIDSSRRVLGGNNWNGNSRGGVGSNDNGNGGDSSSRNNGGRGSGHWSNYGRNGSGNSNGGGRGGRNRRDHDRGANFSPRNYSRILSVQQQQQGFYQPGPFQRPPPPPATHFMMPQPFGPYVPPYAYLGDVQTYPLYVTPFEQQFQNMHLIQQTMQPLVAQQDQLNLQHDIQHQIEYYFSTNNLCRDTYLRERMDDQGWVPIDLIATFPMCIRFTMLGVDTNYILDSLRGSELLEVQGNNIRRRNDWAAWLLRRGPPPSN